MSQPWHQQPQPGQPGYGYPQQPSPPPGYGYPHQPGPYGYPNQPGAAGPVPPPPPPPPVGRPARPGLALTLAAAAAVGLLLLYGFLTGVVVDVDGMMEEAARGGEADTEIDQLTWLAAGIGALIGLPAGRLAGGQVWVYWLGGLLALGAILLGETFATAVLLSDASQGAESAFSLFFDHFSDMWEGWTEEAHGVTWLLAALAPAAAIFTGYLLGGNGARPAAPPQPPPSPWG